MSRMRIALLITLVTACAIPDHGPMMNPGDDCLGCHGNQTGTEKGKTWTVAGTVFGSFSAGADEGVLGAEVRLTDANGRELSLFTNGAGNFYSAEPLAFPLQKACVERNAEVFCMQRDVPNGSCNDCHDNPPKWAAPGRVRSP